MQPQADKSITRFLRVSKQAAFYLYDWTLFLINTEEAYRISQSTISSTSKIVKYTKNAIFETPHFIGDCLSNDNAPKLFTYSGLLAINYLLPVFIANYTYSFLENKLESNQENLPSCITWLLQCSLMLLNFTLFLFLSLRKFQLQLHTTILLMKLPPEFRRMKMLHDIKKQLDAHKLLDAEMPVDLKTIRNIKKSVIESHQSPCLTQCNQLKFIEGDIRAILIFFIRESTVWSIKKIPYIWPLAYYAQMSFSGLAMLEYRLSDQCEEHRNKKFNAHGEWFFMFGLFLQATIFLSLALIQLFSFIPKIICERYLGNAFLLSGLAETFFVMPITAYENYFGSIIMLFLVGLSHYVPFPEPTEKASVPFFDFRTRRFTNFLVAGFKDEFKSAINDDNKPVNADNALPKILKLLNDCELLMKQKPDLVKIESSELTKTKSDLTRLSLIKLGRAKLRGVLASHIIEYNKKSTHAINGYLNTLISFFVPDLFRNFSNDPVVSEYLPSLIIKVNGALDAMIASRQLALDIFEYTRTINEFCTQRAFVWGEWLLGISAFTQVFTYEFFMEKGPAYLDDLLLLYRKVATKQSYAQAERKIAIFKKHMGMIKKIIKELPASAAQELFNLLHDEKFLSKLAILKSFLMDMLVTNEKGLASLGFDRIEAVRDPRLDASDCYFPGETITSDFYQPEETRRLDSLTTTDAQFPDDTQKSMVENAHRVNTRSNTIPRSASAAACLWVEETGLRLFKPTPDIDTDSENGFVADIPPGGSEDFRKLYGNGL